MLQLPDVVSVTPGIMTGDQQLITQIQQGNVHAYRMLVSQHKKLVMHMIGRLVTNPEDVEDLCQEVFIKVYQKLDTFNYEAKLSTWIGTIAYRTTLNYLRKKKPDTRGADEDEELERRWMHHHQTPESEMSQKELKSFIHREIGQLPEQYRVIITLYHLQEFSYKEIGEVTGLPEGTVKSYLFRGRKMLKDRLKIFAPKETSL